jgi:phosphoglycolate phosphatase
MHFDGLIFDLDGTLWDCAQASAEGINRAYERHGIETRITREFVASISGKPAREFDEIILKDVEADTRPQLIESLDELEIKAVSEYATRALYPDVKSGLKKLQSHFKLFLVSNCGVRYLEAFRCHSGIGDLFIDYECFGRTEKLKDENIRAVITRQGLTSACYIGDTAGDEDAARKAGVPFFHARYGFGEPSGNPPAFETFQELVDYFVERAATVSSQPRLASSAHTTQRR